MNRICRLLLYTILFLGILTFPYIAEICIDVWVWLCKTIDTNCLIASLCIAGIFLFMEFLIHTCKQERKNEADKYKTTVSPLYYDSPSSNDIFNRRSYAKLLLNKIYSSFYSNNSQEQIAKHSFVIHIGEHYGQGKTSFLMMLEEEIKEDLSETKQQKFNFEDNQVEDEFLPKVKELLIKKYGVLYKRIGIPYLFCIEKYRSWDTKTAFLKLFNIPIFRYEKSIKR